MVASKMVLTWPAKVEPPRHFEALANQSMACCFCALVQPVSMTRSEYIKSICPG